MLYSIAIGATTLNNPQSELARQSFHMLHFIMGGAIVTGLRLVKAELKNSIERDE